MAKKRSEAFEKQNMFILIMLIIFFILTILLYFIFNIFSLDNKSVSENSPQITVSKVIDGDTFELSSGETVRLICIDAPEKNKKGYEESKQFLSNLILNRQVRLEKDSSETDSYGRLLRYVYINITTDSCSFEPSNPSEISDQTCTGSDIKTKEIFVNKEIIKNGHGTLFPYKNNTKRCSEIANE